MITKRDREIINFIESIGFITIEQCSKLFFSTSNYSYDLARKRLKKIAEQADYIRYFQNSETKQVIYVPKESKVKRISKHNLLALDYLAELKVLGVDFEKIEMEKNFNGVIPDMFLIFQFGGYRYFQLVEIQLRHDMVDVNRFQGVMNEIVSETDGDTIPRLIIIQNTRKDYSLDNTTELEIVQLNIALDDVAKVLL